MSEAEPTVERLAREVGFLRKLLDSTSQIHRQRGRSFAEFLSLRCEFGVDFTIESENLSAAWRSWLKERDEFPCEPSVTGKLIRMMVPNVRFRTSSPKNKKSIYMGLRLIGEKNAVNLNPNPAPSLLPREDDNVDADYVRELFPKAELFDERGGNGSTPPYFVSLGDNPSGDGPTIFGPARTKDDAWEMAASEVSKRDTR